jgi:hypothetical protein
LAFEYLSEEGIYGKKYLCIDPMLKRERFHPDWVTNFPWLPLLPPGLLSIFIILFL